MMKIWQCTPYTLQRNMAGKSVLASGTAACKSSLIDRFVEKLPEMHIKGYHYCGPNTDLSLHKPGINELDCLCMDHDIAYGESSDIEWRYAADKSLLLRAFKRVHANDSRIGERAAALFVSMLISIKISLDRSDLFIRNIVKYLVAILKKLFRINASRCE